MFLLIDCSVLPNIKKRENCDTGLICSLDEKDVELLKQKSNKKRLELFNSAEFQSRIKSNCYLFIYNKKKLCICDSRSATICSEFLDVIEREFPNHTLWFYSDLSDFKKIKKLVEHGFTEPYISKKTPDSKEITESLILIKKKNLIDNSAMNKVLDVLEQSKNSHCSITISFESKAIEFLKNASKHGEDSSKKQKEITGELIIDKVDNINNRIIYYIGVDKNSIEKGEHESVDVSATRYNFHSHPEEAYIRHSVDRAWPSATDYVGYLGLGNSTIFHCVASLEGLYIISFTRYWFNRLNKVSKNFIMNSYNISYKEKLSPDEYVKKVNKILYHGYPIFKVLYLNWQNSTKPFDIDYSKTENTCISSQSVMDIIEEFHK